MTLRRWEDYPIQVAPSLVQLQSLGNARAAQARRRIKCVLTMTTSHKTNHEIRAINAGSQDFCFTVGRETLCSC